METLQPLIKVQGCIHRDQTDGQEFYECEDCEHRACEKTTKEVRLLVSSIVPDWFVDKRPNIIR